MAVDTDYLDELMKSIEPTIYPDGVPGEENEEQEEVFGEGEAFENEYEMELASIPEKPSANQQSESEKQVQSALEAVDGSNELTVESESTGEGWDEIGGSTSEAGKYDEPQEIELDVNMSEEEIDAMLNAAKSAGSEEAVKVSESDDVTDLLSLFGDDSDMNDIKETLEKADNNIAIDQSALDEPEVVIPDLDEKEEEQEEVKEKSKGKKEKKPKKEKAEKEPKEKKEKEKKPGFFSRLFGALTEEVEEEVPEQSETGITDENAQILAELDSEDKGKKKKKKKDKKGKDKKEQAETEGSESDIREKSDDEEAAPEKGKKKKPKKEKKKKEPADEGQSKPSKKLPKKRVRATFILCFSILAAILILCFFVTDFMTKRNARYAYDKADYETAYSDLYGMELDGEDAEIYQKSRTIMFLQRKISSYENYMQLGMKPEALNALLEGYDLYPSVMAKAEEYGVTEQVKELYNVLVSDLATFGLTTMDAEEINSYTSSVMYNKRILSIVNNTPFEYDGAGAETEVMTEEPEQTGTMEDILPEEEDFLPDNPEEVFEE